MIYTVTGTSTRGPVTLGGMSKSWKVKERLPTAGQELVVVMGEATVKEGLIIRLRLIRQSRTELVRSTAIVGKTEAVLMV